jgi:dTDP-4-dehydrorhamnose 3,5-epimerase-like enzyme
MQMVKIRFTDATREAEGFVALAKQVHVVCFADDTYEIAKPHLKILDDLNIPYEVITEEGFDYVCHALRNSLAAQIQ